MYPDMKMIGRPRRISAVRLGAEPENECSDADEGYQQGENDWVGEGERAATPRLGSGSTRRTGWDSNPRYP